MVLGVFCELPSQVKVSRLRNIAIMAPEIASVLYGIKNIQVEVQIVGKLNKIPIWKREGDVTKNCTQEILTTASTDDA
jgi:hypothetical protein